MIGKEGNLAGGKVPDEGTFRNGLPSITKSPLRPSLAGWWAKVPYGIWTCRDGREVLFNRAYYPLYQRRPAQPAERIKEWCWVHWSTQDYFFDDSICHVPGGWEKAIVRINAVLKDWGLPPLGSRCAKKRSGGGDGGWYE
jgi:hypothetical protein